MRRGVAYPQEGVHHGLPGVGGRLGILDDGGWVCHGRQMKTRAAGGGGLRGRGGWGGGGGEGGRKEGMRGGMAAAALQAGTMGVGAQGRSELGVSEGRQRGAWQERGGCVRGSSAAGREQEDGGRQ